MHLAIVRTVLILTQFPRRTARIKAGMFVLVIARRLGQVLPNPMHYLILVSIKKINRILSVQVGNNHEKNSLPRTLYNLPTHSHTFFLRTIWFRYALYIYGHVWRAVWPGRPVCRHCCMGCFCHVNDGG